MTVNLKELYGYYQQHPVISTDSREIFSGCLFFALKGDNFDGNEYALQALQKGAAFAVVDDPVLAEQEGCLFVENTLKALQDLAIEHRNRLSIPFLGITGSNGKTTTKELITKVLGQKYNVMATEGNLNNHIGVPLTILKVTEQHEIAVIEMGANHPGEIATLARLARPGYGIITNVGKAHLEGFGSMEGVKKTKKELFDYIQRVEGIVLLNIEDYDLVMMAGNVSRLTYGSTTITADVIAKDIKADPFLQITWKSVNHFDQYEIATHLLGWYNWTNVMAAVAAGVLFGVAPRKINEAIVSYNPSNNRSQFLETADNDVIMDAYNANPTSMQMALKNFLQLNKHQKCLILGEMMELGNEAQKEHDAIMQIIRENRTKLDKVMLVGKQFCAVAIQDTLQFNTTGEIIQYIKENPMTGKTILIKGSRGNKLEMLTDVL